MGLPSSLRNRLWNSKSKLSCENDTPATSACWIEPVAKRVGQVGLADRDAVGGVARMAARTTRPEAKPCIGVCCRPGRSPD